MFNIENIIHTNINVTDITIDILEFLVITLIIIAVVNADKISNK